MFQKWVYEFSKTSGHEFLSPSVIMTKDGVKYEGKGAEWDGTPTLFVPEDFKSRLKVF